jgi:subtilisin family serine protease
MFNKAQKMTTLNKISQALFKSPLVLLLLFVSLSAANTPNTENPTSRIGQIPPGERPPIDLDNVSQDHIEPGKLYVKFRTEMDKSLDQGMFTSKNNEPVSVGHSSIDNLSRQFGVSLIKPMLYELNQLPEKGSLRTEQHRAHGLHLWYELGLDEQADVVSAANAFSALAEVEFAEPVFRKALVEPVSAQEITEADLLSTKMSPGDQLYGLQWGFNNTGQDIRGTSGLPGADIGAEVAWETVQGNPGIIVAVIDQGFEYGHPDLAANVWAGIGPEGTATVAGNHGTHVAGTIAAVSNNGVGVAGTAGGNGGPESGVKVMSIDIFNGSHGMNKLQVNIYAADHGAVISQNSWGYIAEGVYNQADLDGIDYFNTYAGGGILGGGLTIFAAGNSNSSGKWYPAYYSGAMAIAATTNKDEKAGFSNYGDWIDLAAPGSEIASTAGGSYYWMSGTSMACPHVSGVAALVLSHAPGAMTNQQLWNLLVSTTDNIDARNPEHAGLLGSGRLSARLAIEAAKNFDGNSPTTKHTITSSAGPGGVINPVGKIEVAEGSNQYFSITPQDGYMITDVMVDGISIGAVSNHTFINVRKDHAIHASFTEDNGVKYNINASAGKNGSINPIGDITVREGSSQSFTIKPNNGYYILDVAVDNVSIGVVSSYTFQDISANHTIRAAFREITGTSYSITASAGANGSISPTGTITIAEGNSQTFAIAPNQGYEIADVAVNNVSVGPVSSYTFNNITADHTIHAVFAEVVAETHTITASAGANGSISPTGTSVIEEGSSQTFSIAPSQGHEIADVAVNNVSVGPVSSYTFNNVTADHTIHAVFAEVVAETHSITASAGANGSISPTGTVSIEEGSSHTFTITPSQGHEIADVAVNNVSVGPVSSYTFNNVTADHTIHAIFAEVVAETHNITASAGTNGSISPTGTIAVEEGSSHTFTITPDNGYYIYDVAVDNVSIGMVSSYTFNNVAADHTIHAVFAEVVAETYTITASAGTNGSISPTGTIAVEEGSSHTFTITPEPGP